MRVIEIPTALTPALSREERERGHSGYFAAASMLSLL
jgi:hypothetical protein